MERFQVRYRTSYRTLYLSRYRIVGVIAPAVQRNKCAHGTCIGNPRWAEFTFWLLPSKNGNEFELSRDRGPIPSPFRVIDMQMQGPDMIVLRQDEICCSSIVPLAVQVRQIHC